MVEKGIRALSTRHSRAMSALTHQLSGLIALGVTDMTDGTTWKVSSVTIKLIDGRLFSGITKARKAHLTPSQDQCQVTTDEKTGASL